MRIYLHALGCKLNQSETGALARTFCAAGHAIAGDALTADCCIVNTCTVTHVAARKSRQVIRRLRRENPDTHIVVTGCYAQMSYDEVEALDEVDLVVKNAHKDKLPDMIEREFPRSTHEMSPPTPWLAPRTRGLVKIQDGCDNHCTYCIVTLARGPQRSLPVDEIVTEVSQYVAEGCKEIVLTGVHIGAYAGETESVPGSPREPRFLRLNALVEKILAYTDTARIRLSSIEPWDLDRNLLSLWDNPRLCRHLHLPLQSGCDATLQRMNRRYNTQEFARKVQLARQAIHGIAITTDIIVGFPGETDAEFAATMSFAQHIGFGRIHVFEYSPRPGTPAAEMPGQVPPPEKADRSQAMRRLALAERAAFAKRFLAETDSVLWETSSPEHVWNGLTDHYLRVYAYSERDLRNTITKAQLLSLHANGLWATVV